MKAGRRTNLVPIADTRPQKKQIGFGWAHTILGRHKQTTFSVSRQIANSGDEEFSVGREGQGWALRLRYSPARPLSLRLPFRTRPRLQTPAARVLARVH